MKLLLFSDLHCDVVAAKRLAERAAAVDVLVGAGDFGNLRRHVDRCVSVLQQSARPAVLTPGNNESASELRSACRQWPEAHVLHGGAAEIAGVTFFGLGGGVPLTPFGSWSFDLTEDEAEALLQACPAECVLVVHAPPQGTVDVDSRGRHLGSTAIRDAIRRVRPRLVVCGHIHASGGQTGDLDGVPVVNAGPAGVLWEL